MFEDSTFESGGKIKSKSGRWILIRVILLVLVAITAGFAYDDATTVVYKFLDPHNFFDPAGRGIELYTACTTFHNETCMSRRQAFLSGQMRCEVNPFGGNSWNTLGFEECKNIFALLEFPEKVNEYQKLTFMWGAASLVLGAVLLFSFRRSSAARSE